MQINFKPIVNGQILFAKTSINVQICGKFSQISFVMLIANPIYDAVFKYLLEDNKIAKLLIGAIIGEKIETLDFRPQEYVAELEKPKRVKVKKSEIYRTI